MDLKISNSPLTEGNGGGSESADESAGLLFTGSLLPITMAEIDEVWSLDHRCFVDGEAYELETFRFLLSSPNAIARQIRTNDGQMAAFIVALIEMDGMGHITAVGVDPPWRRLGLARILLVEIEETLRQRGVNTLRLEVRVENEGAIRLYEELGFMVVQRLARYYHSANGSSASSANSASTASTDGYMMIKSLSGHDIG
jgi:ribosomal-protein-alanine N-acetyltransferase